MVRQQSGAAGFSAFIPSPLPPRPALILDGTLQERLETASREVGRLDSITTLLPNPGLFIYMYVRKEAVLSSQIEGTQSSLSDLLRAENDGTAGVPFDDVNEVLNYTAAMEHGLERLENGFPLSLRLLRDIHRILMTGARGGNRTPGEFRTSQNWIGGSRPGNARFVPPPAHEMQEAMASLEKFLHDEGVRMPLLVRTGLVHAQFETIHPFLDGNGRMGRLLITFLLCNGGALSKPLLYLSLYLKENRDEYYERLQRVRTHGDWEGWMNFYLVGVETVARLATQTASRIIGLFERDRRRIHALGKGAASALSVFEILRNRAIVSIPRAVKELNLSKQTVNAAVRRIEGLGIIREESGRLRGRHWAYAEYIELLNAGTSS